MASSLSLLALVVVVICVKAAMAEEKFYINDGETDITYDEEVDTFDGFPTVDIALSSFVIWNILSVLAGMCACCFIQSGYAHFAEQEDHVPSTKETPY